MSPLPPAHLALRVRGARRLAARLRVHAGASLAARREPPRPGSPPGLGILYVGNAGAYTAALEHTPASLVAIITYLYPAMVAVISMRYARRLEGRRAWVALALSTAGVALAVGGIPADAQVPVSGICSRSRVPCATPCGSSSRRAFAASVPDASRGPPRPSPPRAPRTPGRPPKARTRWRPAAVMSTTTALTAAVLALLMGGDPSPTVVPARPGRRWWASGCSQASRWSRSRGHPPHRGRTGGAREHRRAGLHHRARHASPG